MRLSVFGARVCVTCAMILLLFVTPTRSGALGVFDEVVHKSVCEFAYT